MVILDREISWLREFVLERCETAVEQKDAQAIVITFKKLWKVARAAKASGYKSPRLEEALKGLWG